MTPQRILFAAEFWPGATGAGLAHGLRALGHEVIELDFRDWLGAKGLAQRAYRRVFMNQAVKRYNAALIELARAEKPDLFLTVKGSFIPPETVDLIRAGGASCVNFYPDVLFRHPGLSPLAIRAYDLIATTKSYHLDWLRKNVGADHFAFVHHGYVESVHHPIDLPGNEADYRFDICYIGNPSAYKCDWLEAVCRAHPDKKILIAGNRWDQIAKSPAFRTATIMPTQVGDDFARLICQSRINLAIHYGPSANTVWQDNVSTRSFEIPACQGFMLHIDNAEARALFDVGSEIDVFSDSEELNRKIDHYLDNPEERERIKLAGYRRAVPHYGFDVRARELMEAVDQKVLAKAGVKTAPTVAKANAPQHVLFVGEFWEGATGTGLAHGLRALGHDVVELDWREWIGRFGTANIGRVANRLSYRQDVEDFNRTIIARASVFKPQIMLTTKGLYIEADTLENLQARGVTCVNFYPDVSFSHQGMSEALLRHYDLIATTKTFQMDWLKAHIGEERRCFVQHGYSTGIHMPLDVPDDENGYDWDICYVGNPSRYKQRWMEAVCAAFPDRRVAIIGNNWGKFLSGARAGNAKVLPARQGHDYARVVSRSKINLGVHYGPAGPQGWEDRISTRSFHVPASQGFMLHIDNSEIRALYDVGTEIDVFSTPEELIERIGHYLDHTGQRRAMAVAGYHRAVPAYSMDARAVDLMREITNRQKALPSLRV